MPHLTEEERGRLKRHAANVLMAHSAVLFEDFSTCALAMAYADRVLTSAKTESSFQKSTELPWVCAWVATKFAETKFLSVENLVAHAPGVSAKCILKGEKDLVVALEWDLHLETVMFWLKREEIQAEHVRRRLALYFQHVHLDAFSPKAMAMAISEQDTKEEEVFACCAVLGCLEEVIDTPP